MNGRLVLFAIASYLIGAIPFGLIIASIKGVDIRKVGSCNIGATNVLRSVGKPWGIATFIADALKGFLPAFLFPRWLPGTDPTLTSIVCGFSAILGHNFPVYLKFKGGKGVATSAGALLGIAPLAVAIGGAMWALIFFTTRYVSLASIAICIVVPAAS
ncbi:MAG TPA: glycerol-3-phosphate 1-O-acyltransferase PlsY, partial [Kiritimatiellia bacterium]